MKVHRIVYWLRFGAVTMMSAAATVAFLNVASAFASDVSPDGLKLASGVVRAPAYETLTTGMDIPGANPNAPRIQTRAMLGHSDRSGGQNTSWNAAHMSQGCSKQALINTGGAGRFYCFAIN